MTDMMMINIAFIVCLVAEALFAFYFFTGKKLLARYGTWAIWGTLFTLCGAAVIRMNRVWADGQGLAQLHTYFEPAIIFAMAILLIFLIIDYRYKLSSLGVFVIVFACGILYWMQSFIDSAMVYWGANIYWSICAFVANGFGYAAYAVAFGVAVAFLLRVGYEKKTPLKETEAGVALLPPAALLDKVFGQGLRAGLALQTVGMICYAMWANFAWGAYWTWDQTEIASLTGWLIYASILLGRARFDGNGRWSAWVTILGSMLFACIFYSYRYGDIGHGFCSTYG